MSSNSVRVVPVRSSQDLDEFLRFPWKVQADDPCWVPPVLAQQREYLDKEKGVFFDFGEAEYFLAYRGDEILGRITAQTNSMHDQRYNDSTGFFGFFECVNDTHVSNALFDAAADWVRSKGKTRILGPLGFGIYEEVGILVDGYDTLPALLLTHNPPYYHDLVKAWGFTKAVDWFALRKTDFNDDIPELQKKLDIIMKDNDLVLKPAKPKDISRLKDEVLELFNSAWGNNWGHVPFTRRQFHQIIKELMPLLRMELNRLIMKGDELVAFIINIPDLNPTIQKLNGKLKPWDYLRLYYESRFKKLKKVRTVLLGVKPEYQMRNLHHALIISSIIEIGQNGPEFVDCSLVSEPLMTFIKSLEVYKVYPYKTYRLFERGI